jgi:hypothetical protein
MRPDLLDAAMLMRKRHVRTITVWKQHGWTKASHLLLGGSGTGMKSQELSQFSSDVSSMPH